LKRSRARERGAGMPSNESPAIAHVKGVNGFARG
jgi:hypothetical protein